VCLSRELVDQYGPGDPLLTLILPGRLQLLFVTPVRGTLLPRVRLPDKDVEKLYPIAVPLVEPFPRRDRAGG
jgi:hypothetical protein